MPSPVWLAIKLAKPALFMSGLLIVSDVKLVATLFAVVESRDDGDGDGVVELVRGVSSRLIVLVSTLASAGAWPEFRLITPPRIAAVAVGVGLGVTIGLPVGVGEGVAGAPL